MGEELRETHAGVTGCCVPPGCHLGEPLPVDDFSEVVRVSCNNENCKEGTFMHKVCFDLWQQTVLTYLKSTGRARSWSDKQRLQNLWTKKGYDLAYKACNCKCGKGHLRKDLDWVPPPPPVREPCKKKKNKRRKNDKPSLTLNRSLVQTRSSLPIMQVVSSPRIRSSSISSSSSGSPSFAGVDGPQSPHNSEAKFSASGLPFATFPIRGPVQSEPRHDCGIFAHRQDFSSFNTLPRNKLNSYHIKMANEKSGSDSLKCIALSTFTKYNRNIIGCVFCRADMIIYDSFPLIDGTLFISPLQQHCSAVPLDTSLGRYYLNAVCINCLAGRNTVRCHYCSSRWDGSDLIIGTLYSYDILASKPCCLDRYKCKKCTNLLLFIKKKRVIYFSDYSQFVPCPMCATCDFHFVKPASWYSCETL